MAESQQGIGHDTILNAGEVDTNNPKRERRRTFCLAHASGSTNQTTRIVTTSPRPTIAASALLELVQWCQFHLRIMEDTSCPSRLPPAVAVVDSARVAPVSQSGSVDNFSRTGATGSDSGAGDLALSVAAPRPSGGAS